MESRFFCYVVVADGLIAIELLSTEDKPLLIRWDSFFILDLGLDHFDVVGWLDLESDGLAGEGAYKDLHELLMFFRELVEEKLEDMGSGLNYKRKSFLVLMEMVERGEVSEIVIAHKDRLVRFGFEWFEKFCLDHGCVIVVMNAETLSPEQEMTQDLLSIIHCFSSRLYGLRKYKKKLHEMVTEHENDQAS